MNSILNLNCLIFEQQPPLNYVPNSHNSVAMAALGLFNHSRTQNIYSFNNFSYPNGQTTCQKCYVFLI